MLLADGVKLAKDAEFLSKPQEVAAAQRSGVVAAVEAAAAQRQDRERQTQQSHLSIS